MVALRQRKERVFESRQRQFAWCSVYLNRQIKNIWGNNGEGCPFPATLWQGVYTSSSYPYRTWGDVFFKFSHKVFGDTGYTMTWSKEASRLWRFNNYMAQWGLPSCHTMLYRITVKQNKNTNGIRLDKGMSVEVVTNSYSNPVTTNGGQCVVDAFMRIYGVDIKKAGALNMVYLDCQRVN